MLAVTGATGFVGRHLCATLAEAGLPVRPIARMPAEGAMAVGDIGPDTGWRDALSGVTGVVHLAARVHHMRERDPDPLAAYRHTNLHGTLRLAREALACGVRRLVFVSTIKVNGDATLPGRPFRADDAVQPSDPYARSKWEAEQALRQLAAGTGLEIVVVRPPLVYGAGVGANFRALVSLVERRLPLPFASVRNARSLIAVENLAHLLSRCVTEPAAAGGTFLCSDGQDVSTPELLRAIAQASGIPVRLLPAAPWGLQAIAGMLGRQEAMSRLTGSLQVDMTPTRRRLEWHPPVTMAASLSRAAALRWHADPLR